MVSLRFVGDRNAWKPRGFNPNLAYIEKGLSSQPGDFLLQTRSMKIFASTLLMLAVLAAPAISQESTLVDTPATPDELIADQRTIVPCRMPVEFTSFRYPHLDKDLSVTFIADDPYHRGGKKFGIYRSDGSTGKLEKLVNNEDAPGTSAVAFDEFLGLQVEGRKFVFRGRRADGGGGIYGDFGDGIRVIADTSTPAVPAFGAFRTFAYGDVSGDTAIFTASDSAEIDGLFAYNSETRTLRRLADTTSVLPNGSKISSFNGQPWIDAEAIVFRGLDQDGLPAIYKIARAALKSSAPVPVEILFDQTTPLPVPVRVTRLTSAPVAGNIVAFVAYGLDSTGADYTGIFFLRDGKVSLIADNRTELPEDNVAFRSFDKWIALQDGMVIFRGKDTQGFEGVFAYDTESADLHQLINNRASIGGRRIRTFEIASNPVVNTRIAFLAVFADGKDALYLASLPTGGLKKSAAK